MGKRLGALLLAAVWWTGRTVGGEPSPPSQQARLLEASITRSARLSYLLFLPAAYPRDPSARWPLILYLHGGSLRGDQVDRLRTLGLPHRLESEPDFPFIVVSPQCPAGEIWSDADAIGALLDRVMLDYRVDPGRVYVTGHSMGGRGALYLASRLPGRFAAVAALSPASSVTAWAGTLARLPLWIVHGAADGIAPVVDSRELVQAVEDAGGHPVLSVLAGRDHFILDAYEQPELYAWLLQHRRGEAGCRAGAPPAG